jgi:SAM-dependent methyltransferase
MSLYERITQKLRNIYLEKIALPFFSIALPNNFFQKQKGFCSCCDKQVTFYSFEAYLRSGYRCNNCHSIPRERAIMQAIERYYPNWREIKIHESSPIQKGASLKIKRGAKSYMESQYFPNQVLGTIIEGFRNEDLENQTFEDESFDLVITQDVFEHLYYPEKAFAEIHRTLRKGGSHILTVPIENKFNPTVKWAELNKDGNNVFLQKPEFHGNPVNDEGSAVTWHWGYDIVNVIEKSTGVKPHIETWEDSDNGIKAELIEVIVIKKD